MEGANDHEADVPDALWAEVVSAEDLLQIDATGQDGRQGHDGRGYGGQSASQGRPGRDGENASRPTRGEDGGDIEVTLRSSGQNDQLVEVSGRQVTADQRIRSLRESVTIGSQGYLRLVAVGGRGGDGAAGGTGEGGGKGHRGADATRWSAGQDGGPGGEGGNGGAGTSGAEGGSGGRIAILTDEHETHLLMLCKTKVDGGQGGSPGTHGRGGQGGPGGDGGRPYTWTTTSTQHYTDAQGNMRTRPVVHRHRNRGGFDGRPGRPGRSGQGPLREGPDGPDGQVQIFVRYAGRTIEYQERYEVEVTGYEVTLTDAFAEPTSALRVSNITVRNRGGMPTPGRYPVELFLATSKWVAPRQHTLLIPNSLEPGESYRFTDDLLLAAVPDIDEVPTGDPLRESDFIAPLTRQTKANRPFQNQHQRREFLVAFPTELQPIESLESQAAGRAAMFVVRVTNRSQHDLGTESETARMLAVRLELQNQDMAPHIMLLDMDGQKFDWQEGFREEIPQLAAGQTWSKDLIVGILPGAPGYRQAELKLTLELGQLSRPHDSKDRHCLIYPVRVATAYRYDPSADLLLITNHGTTQDELAAWQKAAARLGQTIGVWDISLNDSLSLSEKLEHGQNLLRDFHGRTIVLANAPFQTALGSRYGDQFLSQMDLIKAAESHGIRVLVVNDEHHELAHLFEERLIPTDGEPDYRYDSLDALQKAEPLDDVDVLIDQVDELIKHGSAAARPNPISQTSEVDLYGIRSPNAKRLRKQAIELQKRLQNDSPGRRVVVMYKLPSDETPAEQEKRAQQPERGGWFFTHDYQGTLSVMPTIGDDHPNLVVLDATSEGIHDPVFIEGASVSAGVAQALSFEERVYLLSDKMRSLGEQWRIDPESVTDADIAVAEFLVDAILVDLATEQAAIMKTPWKSLFGGKVVRESLRQLKVLADHPFPFISGSTDQPDVKLAARLAAGVEFLGRNSSRWYESRVFPWGFFRRGPILRSEILKYHGELVQNLFRKPNEAQHELMDQLNAAYYQRLKETRRETKLDKRTAARHVLFTPLSQYGISTDAGRTFPTVLSYQEWKAVQQAEGKREESRVTLRTRKEESRAALAVARKGQPLPGTSEQLQQALEPFVAACRAKQEELIEQVKTSPRMTAKSRWETPIAIGKTEDEAATETERVRTEEMLQDEA